MYYRDRALMEQKDCAASPMVGVQTAPGKFDKSDGMEEKRQPQVEIEANRLISLANSLAAKISDIEQRLQPVLSVSPMQGGEGRPAQPKCALAAELSDVGDKLQEILEHSKSILERLEV